MQDEIYGSWADQQYDKQVVWPDEEVNIDGIDVDDDFIPHDDDDDVVY